MKNQSSVEEGLTTIRRRVCRVQLIAGAGLMAASAVVSGQSLGRALIDGHSSPCPFGTTRADTGGGAYDCRSTTSIIDGMGSGGGTSYIPENEAIRDGDPVNGKDSSTERGPPCGNPVLIATGNKIETNLDFAARGDFGLKVERNWNDYSSAVGIFGAKTSTLMDQRIVVETANQLNIRLWTKDGDTIRFVGSVAGNRWATVPYDANSREYISKNAAGQWIYALDDGSTLTFEAVGKPFEGRVLEIRRPTGERWTLNYRDLGTRTVSYKVLESVTHSSGRTMRFSYKTIGTARVVDQAFDPAGRAYTYDYKLGSDNRPYLSSVIYPQASGETIDSSVTHAIGYEIDALNHYAGKFIDGVRYSSFSYDTTSGRALTSSHANGAESFTFSYNVGSTTVTNPLGQQTTYYFDSNSNVIRTEGLASLYCQAVASSTVIDPVARTITTTDENNYVVRTRTNTDGDLIEEIRGYGGTSPITTTYDWNRFPKRLKEINTETLKTKYTYSANNRLETMTQTDMVGTSGTSLKVSYAYSESSTPGLLLTSVQTGPLTAAEASVTTNYTTQGDIGSIVNGNGKSISYGGFNNMGVPTNFTDMNGIVTTFALDGRDQVLSASRAGQIAKIAYTALGEVSQTQAVDGLVTTIARDAAQRVTGSSQADTYRASIQGIGGARVGVTLDLDSQGNPLSMRFWGNGIARPSDNASGSTDPTIGLSNWTDYDEYGRVRQQRGNNGQVTFYDRYAGGPLHTLKDATGLIFSKLTYDEHMRVQSSADGINASTTYRYYSDGRIKTVTDAQNRSTNYVYDGFGNLHRLESPDTGITSFEYNSSGQLHQSTRADQSTVVYDYYADGRVKTLTAMAADGASGKIVRTYSYDSCTYGVGRLCSVSESTGESSSYTYTSTGALQTQSDVIAGQTLTTRWDYDGATGRLATLTYPNGYKLSYTWQDGQLRRVQANLGAGWVDVVNKALYQPHGSVESFTDSLNQARTRSIDSDGRLSGSTGQAGNQGFFYNTRDQLITLTGSDISDVAYDDAGRVKSATQVPISAASSIASEAGDYSTASSGNQLESVTLNGSMRNLQYDVLGNLVSDQLAGKTRCLQYDTFNRLVRFDSFNAAVNCPSTAAVIGGLYTYNGLNQRSYKQSASYNTRFVYGRSGELLYETDSTGRSRGYFWFGGEIVAIGQTGAVLSVYSDQIGRPRTVLDVSGARWIARMNVFGRAVTTDTINGFNVGYPGQYFDVESGLWQNWNRYYDPSIGRYTQSDPIGLMGGINTYVYSNNSPTLNTDFTGLLWYGAHLRITFQAAQICGFGLMDSLKLAWNVMAADFGTQGKDADQTVIHAMGGMVSDGCGGKRKQTEQEAKDAADAYIANADNPLERRMHAAEDRAAPWHYGESWTSDVSLAEKVSHIYNDVFYGDAIGQAALAGATSVLCGK